jgi:hypothetical protein
MSRPRSFLVILLLCVVVLFFTGLGLLVRDRFESGDAYPPYSSYNREPSGTGALFEALNSMSGTTAQRNTKDLVVDPKSPGKTLFIVGLRKDTFLKADEESAAQLDASVRGGDRLVIAFAPEKAGQRQNAGQTADSGKGEKRGTAKDQSSHLPSGKDLRTQWAIDFDHSDEAEGPADLRSPVPGLPKTVAWHSSLALNPTQPDWKTVFSKQGKPVIVERTLGKGTIVLVSDCFLLTNAAMKDHRSPELISWLCGPHNTIVFDETHLGLMEQPNLATLIKRNGLAPFIGSLIIVALLGIWRQLLPMLPIPKKTRGGIIDTGRGYLQGMANLLRGSLSEGQLLDVCVDEWERAFSHKGGDRSAMVAEARRMIEENKARPRRQRDFSGTYARIAEMMGRDKTFSGRM